jgi:ABC-type multidrug transport system fused ATPase/permease subunit
MWSESDKEEEDRELLPTRWRRAVAPGGSAVYYHNLDTREVSWSKPSLLKAKEPSDNQDVVVVIRRLLSFASEDALLVWCGAACVLLSSACETAIPNFSARALALIVSEDAAGGGDAGAWTPRTFKGAWHGLLLFAVLSAVTTAARIYCSALVEVRLIARIQTRLFASILHQELAFFDASSSGALSSRLTSDVTLLSSSLTTNANLILQSGVNLGLSLLVMLTVSPRMAVAYLAASGVFFALSKYVGGITRAMQRVIQDATSAANGAAVQGISLLRTVRSLGGEEVETAAYALKVDALRLKEERLKLVWTIYSPAVSALNNCLLLGVLAGGRAYVSTPDRAAAFAVFFFYSQRVQNCLTGISNNWTAFLGAVGAGDAVFRLLDRKPALMHGDAAPPLPLGGVELCFEAVAFSYPGRPGVLRGVSLLVPAGGRVAVVGRSGGGKSSLLALALRLYAPDSGRVLLGGTDVATMLPRHLRTVLGAVAQEPPLFAASVRENILYASPDGSESGLEEALRVAHLAPVLAALPDGLDTLVGERGVRLSGGQKQRVAIARALVRSPRLLLLDEATSALDGASEAALQDSLEAHVSARGGGLLLVAHRLSTVRNADTIAVLVDGAVAELGPYDMLMDELLSPEGHFRRLIARQDDWCAAAGQRCLAAELTLTPFSCSRPSVSSEEDPDEI